MIVFVGYQDIAIKIFEAAAEHPILGTSQVLWVGVDAWTGLLLLREDGTSPLPLGTIGITPQVANTPTTVDYINRWSALPPDEYPNADEANRDVLAAYSPTLVDATIALGISLQSVIDEHTDGASFNV